VVSHRSDVGGTFRASEPLGQVTISQRALRPLKSVLRRLIWNPVGKCFQVERGMFDEFPLSSSNPNPGPWPPGRFGLATMAPGAVRWHPTRRSGDLPLDRRGTSRGLMRGQEWERLYASELQGERGHRGPIDAVWNVVSDVTRLDERSGECQGCAWEGRADSRRHYPYRSTEVDSRVIATCGDPAGGVDRDRHSPATLRAKARRVQLAAASCAL
jgi:hypothetical protein